MALDLMDLDRLKATLGKPEFHWIVDRLRLKLQRGEPLEGSIRLRHPTPAQRDALSRLLGKIPSAAGALSLADGYHGASGGACSDCHTVPAVPFSAGHMNGAAELTWSKLSKNVETVPGSQIPYTFAQGALTPSYAGGQCSNTYCHGSTLPGGTDKSPFWTDGNYFTGAASCGKCHGNPPTTSTKYPHGAGDTTSPSRSAHPLADGTTSHHECNTRTGASPVETHPQAEHT